MTGYKAGSSRRPLRNNRKECFRLQTVQELEKAALEIRIDLLRLCHKEVIHIGGDLSVADLMTVLWQYQMKYDPENLQDETRDRFVLSKGHASAVTSFRRPSAVLRQRISSVNTQRTRDGFPCIPAIW